MFEPLEQGNSQATLKKMTVRSMKSHMMEREPDSTPLTILQHRRTDIFITEKKTDEVRAGSLRLELVQGFELGQP